MEQEASLIFDIETNGLLSMLPPSTALLSTIQKQIKRLSTMTQF